MRILNNLDEQLHDLLYNDNGEKDLEAIRQLLNDLSEELKYLWRDKDYAKGLVSEMIDECIAIVTDPLEKQEWDEMKADQLKFLWSHAEVAGEFRDIAGKAAFSKKLEARIAFAKYEFEKQMFFANETAEHLEGMAYRLLNFLNIRNTLLELRKKQ